MKAKLTNVECNYTGGGIYVVTAKYGDVWLTSDLYSYGTYDVPWEDIEEKYGCDYDAHWKDSPVPLPTWRTLLQAIRASYKAGHSQNMLLSEVERIIEHEHPNMDLRLDETEERNDPAMTTKTYAVGNGEITLTEQDAEELRRLLQAERYEKQINKIIDENIDCFKFNSEFNRPHFVHCLVDMCDDDIDVEGCFYENLEEAVFNYANDIGIQR